MHVQLDWHVSGQSWGHPGAVRAPPHAERSRLLLCKAAESRHALLVRRSEGFPGLEGCVHMTNRHALVHTNAREQPKHRRNLRDVPANGRNVFIGAPHMLRPKMGVEDVGTIGLP